MKSSRRVQGRPSSFAQSAKAKSATAIDSEKLRNPISNEGDQIIAKARIAPTATRLRSTQVTEMIDSPVRKGISATMMRPACPTPQSGDIERASLRARERQ